MQSTDFDWTEAEKGIAMAAFEKAYQREVKALITLVREKVGELDDVKSIWQLHDFLSIQRHGLDGKYDSRESALLFVFAQLVQEKWLSLEELAGISDDKLKKISALTSM